MPGATKSGFWRPSKVGPMEENDATVSSLSTDSHGVDTKDGVEGVWDGRRVGAEEVRGLEGLVQGLGRGKKQDVRMEDTDAGAGEGGDGDGEEMDTS